MSLYSKFCVLFPFFDILDGIRIYTFWLTLTLCFFIFLWMLKKLSARFGYKFSFFHSNILWYFLSMFIFSRLFYVISRWNDMKFIENPFEFFIMSDYNFSLMWALFGFFVVLYLNTRLEKTSIKKYIDGTVLASLLAMVAWYAGAFLWWQVYGRDTNFGIEVLYTHAFTPVPYEVAIFPLWVVYSILAFLLFSGLYILSMFIELKWFIGYIGIICFSSFLLIFEFFSWKFDIFKLGIGINLTQICALVLIIVSWWQLYKIMKTATSKIIQRDNFSDI